MLRLVTSTSSASRFFVSPRRFRASSRREGVNTALNPIYRHVNRRGRVVIARRQGARLHLERREDDPVGPRGDAVLGVLAGRTRELVAQLAGLAIGMNQEHPRDA